MSKKLLRSTGLVGSMTLISRILGFLRDVVCAHFFGASAEYDAFLMAFKIPNFMRRLFAEGAFSQAFVPLLAEYRVHKNETEVQQFVNRVAGNLSLVLFLVTLLGIGFSSYIVVIFAPGFLEDPSRHQLATEMLRITFPYLLLISCTALASSILNNYGVFAPPAFTPVFLNVAMIGAAFVLAPFLETPVIALAWGVLLGGIIQLLFQWPFLRRIHFPIYPHVHWRDPGVRRLLKLMAPALLGVSVNQLNLLVDTAFASFLPRGSVSWLYYADRLMEFPLGIFGVALATVVLPNLSKQHAGDNQKRFSEIVDWSLRWIFLIGTPAALGLYWLSGPLILTLFQSKQGHFTEGDVWMTQSALNAYAVGIVGFMLVKVLASSFYARQDIKTPVKVAILTLLSNALLNLLLIHSFAHAGLAFATSASALLNALILFVILYRRKLYQPSTAWGIFFIRLGVACLVLSSFLYWGVPSPESWVEWHSLKRAITLLSVVGAGMGLYACSLWMTGVKARHLFMQEEVSL